MQDLSLPVAHVSDTAYMVAAYRMIESQREDALFHDDLASKLLGAQAGKYLDDAKHAQFGAWMMAVRTFIIDQLIEEKIADGADLIVNLAAGLDTRPYRLNRVPAELRWLEVDFAPVVEHKNKALALQKPKCAVERLAADLTDPNDLARLNEMIRERGKHALVLTEGLLLYLEEHQVNLIARSLHANPAIKWWIAEFAAPRFLQWAVSQWDDERKKQAAVAKPVEVAFRFAKDDLAGYFEERGWVLTGFHSFRDESRALSRMPPTGDMPLEEVLAMVEKSGYGLLEKL